MPRESREAHRPAVPLHECPGPGCADLVSDSRFFSPDCWERIPEDLRKAIWATYDRGRGVGRDAHKAAIAAAVEALSQQGADR